MRQRRDFFLIQVAGGGLNLNCFVVLNPIFYCEKRTGLITCPHHIHEHEMIVWLGIEMRSSSSYLLSPCQHTSLKNFRTLGHWVFASEKLTDHSNW